MRKASAQLLQLAKARPVWLCIGLCLAALSFLAFQFTMNPKSGYLDERAQNASVVSTLFLWLFAVLVGFLPAVVAGSYLGGKDEVHGTQASIVHSGGRIPTLASKLGALLLFSLAVLSCGCGERSSGRSRQQAAKRRRCSAALWAGN